eukprot:sb/3471722/
MGGTLSNIASATGLAQTLTDEEGDDGAGFLRRRKSLDWNQIYDVTLTDLYGHKIQLQAGIHRFAVYHIITRHGFFKKKDSDAECSVALPTSPEQSPSDSDKEKKKRKGNKRKGSRPLSFLSPRLTRRAKTGSPDTDTSDSQKDPPRSWLSPFSIRKRRTVIMPGVTPPPPSLDGTQRRG